MRRTAAGRRDYAYERLGDRFAQALSNYDTARRVDVLVDEFLASTSLAGLSALDAGCGLGFFSERLAMHGATVTACDIAPSLVDATRERVGCTARVADVLELTDTFGANRFDVVVSSECIEHTPDPSSAVEQLVAVAKPRGLIALSTPNVLWKPLVAFASAVKLRPFDGYENFSTWGSLRRSFKKAGATVLQERGLHLFPFQTGAHRALRWCDDHLQIVKPLMINLCVLAMKD
jgi:2-polyprenyl-3-methyl-5-hydroxy-6-metoxy-1,4-benzoquinol methylase